MRLTVIFCVLLGASAFLQSCEKRTDLAPARCNCIIDGERLSEQRLVTYQVAAHDNALVSSITYQTNDGPITTNHPSLPFSTTVQLAKGKTIALQAGGNPGKGAIVLTYDTNNDPHTSTQLSSSASRVWILADGVCR